MKGVVIIGSGHAGCNTAINLRRAGFSESIKIFSKENYYPYHRPPLSKKFFKGDLTEENILLKNSTFYEDNNGGKEFANGFCELNDPDDQAERFADQVAAKDSGDKNCSWCYFWRYRLSGY